MAYLCDTQLLVWLGNVPEKLSKAAMRILRDPENEIYFSLVSIWEIAIKSGLGRPDFRADPKLVERELLNFGLKLLRIESEHVYGVANLPRIHRNPFDRLLVAQAKVEGLTLITADKVLAKYGSFVERV
jgi:PIN domain nuclease of toxin-antitoxin system